MPIRKVLTVDDEKKVVNYLICGEYELTKTSWSKLQKKVQYWQREDLLYTQRKSMPRGLQYRQQQQKQHAQNLETTTPPTSSKSN